MTGLDDTTFGPASELVRAQFAVIIYRMEGSPEVDSSENPFPDNTEDWYKNAVIWVIKKESSQVIRILECLDPMMQLP